jgi:queuosine precursor transporter
MIVVANVVTSHFDQIPAGLGLLVPAGTYAAGITFGLRDSISDYGGRLLVVLSIATASVLSFVVADPAIAWASLAAFAVAEGADFLIYERMRSAGYVILAVVASNTIGSLIDTTVFLGLAPWPWSTAAFIGQLLVKAVWCTLIYLVLRKLLKRVSTRRTSDAVRSRTPSE